MKEKFGDDKQKMQQAMMELYKTEKINPLGGCLPILIQIPVFIALYWVLLGSVELRNASFLYITDLSSKDPYYVLPLLMAASMFLQTKLNPKPTDPMQARLMMMMPIVFSIFFFFFPSGLVLIDTVNNILSMKVDMVVIKKNTCGGIEKERPCLTILLLLPQFQPHLVLVVWALGRQLRLRLHLQKKFVRLFLQ